MPMRNARFHHPVAALVAVVVAFAVFTTIRTRGAAAADGEDIVTHFKYGSIGAEERAGVPYWIWRVLPVVFEDKLPKRPGRGYERLGFIDEGRPGRVIGFTRTDGTVPLAGFNCATCHVGTWREAAGAPRHIVLGMPAHQMDLQGYARFLAAAAGDPRFNADTLLEAIDREEHDLSWFDRLVFRLIVVHRTREGILDRAKENAWFDDRPPQGPGRVDTFNPYKAMFGFDLTKDRTVGTAELPSLWNQRMRQGMWLHWDGNNDRVEERNKSAAIGAGATPKSLDLESLGRIEAWILDLRPPPFPAARIDRSKAERGKAVYAKACASCHAPDGARVGQVTPIDEIGTDRHRLDSFTPELVVKMNTLGQGYPWQFRRFRKTNGYANMPLDGVWLRAPYLHNGAVPTLRALLFPDERPAVFYRAYDVYDWEGVGFVSSGPDAEREGVRFDTSLPGNGNGGHRYGTDLPASDRENLLEYLKTL